MNEDEPGVTIKLGEIYRIVLSLQGLPEQLKVIEHRFNEHVDDQRRAVDGIREELRGEVRNRDEKLASMDARIAVVEAQQKASEAVSVASDKERAARPPWTAIGALIVAGFTAAMTLLKDSLN